MKLTNCISCQSDKIEVLLDLGLQPPSNRFLLSAQSVNDTHPLRFGHCVICGHLQLVDPMPVEMVTPRVNWIFYNEPEGHLDDVVRRFMGLSGINSQSTISGLTYKEDTTLRRLNEQGFCNTHRFDTEKHFHLSSDAGLEKIQLAVTPETTQTLASENGKSDLLFARHILEHAHDPVKFINALKNLVKPDGYLAFEVPDSERFMKLQDYPFIWEEHISYFTEQSLQCFIAMQGLQIIEMLRYPYTFEDSLVVITKLQNQHVQQAEIKEKASSNVAMKFGKNFGNMKESIHSILSHYKSNGKKIGIFGGGHLAVKFLNFFDLADKIDMVLDDHPKKQGLLMPGSSIPIVTSDNIEKLDLCLLSLSPESEQKILDKFSYYTEKGGEFRSIFAASPITIFSQ